MHIEAVTVCVNYGDFLAHTILWNKQVFDRWVIVTTPEDRRTRDLCEHHHLECVTTGEFYRDGCAFAKGAGINAALDRLGMRDWVLHLDADIALPPRAREMIERAKPDPSMIWGCDRILCNSFEDWSRYISWPEVMLQNQAFIKATDFALGARLHSMDGWVPIGFFQLWHPVISQVRSYPDHGDCDRGDVAFARLWPRARRGQIPEIIAIHLESEQALHGANWSGRTTPHFGPSPTKRPIEPAAPADPPAAY